MKIINSVWYGNIGIVNVEKHNGEHQFYIGIGKGVSQKEDEEFIANWGNKFFVEDFQ